MCRSTRAAPRDPHAEILALRGEWNLRADVIEKDYMLG